MISLILIAIAAFFNACMDTFENTPNFNESIFKNLDKRFWLKSESWINKHKIYKIKIPYIWWTKYGKK